MLEQLQTNTTESLWCLLSPSHAPRRPHTSVLHCRTPDCAPTRSTRMTSSTCGSPRRAAHSPSSTTLTASPWAAAPRRAASAPENPETLNPKSTDCHVYAELGVQLAHPQGILGRATSPRRVSAIAARSRKVRSGLWLNSRWSQDVLWRAPWAAPPVLVPRRFLK